MKRLAIGAAVFALMMFLYWLAGNEFERSGLMVLVVIISLAWSSWAALCPYIKD